MLLSAYMNSVSLPDHPTFSVLNRIASLLPGCLRLACIIADTDPRLATGGLANAFPGGVSTR